MVGCIVAGAVPFCILFSVITALTIREFGAIVSKIEGVTINHAVCMLAGVFLFLGFAYIGIAPEHIEVLIPYLLLIIYLTVSELYLKRKNPLHNIAYTMMSQMYVALPLSLLNALAFHASPAYDPVLPLSIFIFTWINDTGAYCTGMLFGKHHLFERISPKKTWEGSIGGCVSGIIAAVVLAQFSPLLPLGKWIGLSVVITIFGTWGDLTESLLKRTLGIKDSGNILPGHGGMLDRFDSTLMAIPASVVYLYFVSFF